MRWKDGRRSDNVDDRRQGGAPKGRGVKLGLGGVLVVVVLAFALGKNPKELLSALGQGAGESGTSATSTGAPTGKDEAADFASVVLADTEDTWKKLFKKNGRTYREPVLVLFRGAVESACGYNKASIGPFYCPGDKKIYVDLEFLDKLQKKLGAKGDFARAYVLSHEVGHHVQTLLGVSSRVRALKAGVSKTEANALTVRQELQADCFAGVWAHHAERQRKILEAGDLEEATGAARAIGDDTLQRRAGRVVRPESFTHGSSAQRKRWFETGMRAGTIASCDTFDGKLGKR